MMKYLVRFLAKRYLPALAGVSRDAVSELQEARDRIREAQAAQAKAEAKAQNEARKARQAEAKAREQTKPHPQPDPPSDPVERRRHFEQMVAMVSHLRPGMGASELDPIEAATNGFLSEAIFRRNPPSRYDLPCGIVFDGNTICQVTFKAQWLDPENVGRFDSVDALMEAVEGARFAPDIAFSHDHPEQVVQLRMGSGGYETFVKFTDKTKGPQTFVETRYMTPKRRQELAAALRQAAEARKAREAAKEAEENARPKADMAAIFDISKRLLQLEQEGPDAVLRGTLGEPETDFDLLQAEFVDWLITQSTPDDRHALLFGFNNDLGLAVPSWIIRQPDTDIASVAAAFWRSEPSFHINLIAKKEAPPGHARADFEFMLEIKHRVEAGFYKPMPGHDAIGFKPPARITWDRSDPAVANAEEMLVPQAVLNPISGRVPDYIGTKMPERFFDCVN